MASRAGESGSVIVLALLITLIILGVGLTVMWVSSSGVRSLGGEGGAGTM